MSDFWAAVRSRTAIGAAVVVAALGVVACGGDDDDEGAAGGGGATSTQAGGGDAAQSGDTTVSAGVDDYFEYVGAKTKGAADKSKEPIVIGFVNQQGGPTDIGPWATDGAKLAVKWLNEQAGGIDGTPVELRTCFTSTSEEQGQTCGQKMLNDPDVKVIEVGAVAIGSQSLNATVGEEKPMVFSVSVGPGDIKNKNGYALFGNGVSVSGPFATYAKDVVKAQSAAIVWPELPGITTATNAIIDGAKKLGMDYKRVSWSPNATDLVGPLTAAGAQSADVIITNPDPKGCVNLAKAIDQLGIDTPVVSEPLCLNEQVAKALGDLPKWTYGIASSLPGDMTDPTARIWEELGCKELGDKTKCHEPWYSTQFHATLTIFKWMNAIGPDNISEETIVEQAKAFKGPQAWGAPQIECGKYPEMPSVCNDQAKFFKYEGKGKFVPAGGWQRPPE